MFIYHQRCGDLVDPGGLLLGTGYSGSPSGKNDPAKQCIPDVGPIPAGYYTIGPSFDAMDTGPLSMNLEPDPENEMCNRSGFRMHGDSIQAPGTASKGCIIMSHPVRETVDASMDRRLLVMP
jgi:hypothetical protein